MIKIKRAQLFILVLLFWTKGELHLEIKFFIILQMKKNLKGLSLQDL